MIHTVKGFGIVNKAEVDAFLELSCFLYDPADVGNLISVSSSLSAIRVVSSAYLRLIDLCQSFFPPSGNLDYSF